MVLLYIYRYVLVKGVIPIILPYRNIRFSQNPFFVFMRGICQFVLCHLCVNKEMQCFNFDDRIPCVQCACSIIIITAICIETISQFMWGAFVCKIAIRTNGLSLCMNVLRKY